MSIETPEPRPDPPHNAVVRFAHGSNDTQVFRASRPDVLLVLKSAQVLQWGWLVECEGTPEQLIAAGVASPDMFENLGKTGQKTDWTPYANQFYVKKRKNGRFDLELRMYPECCDLSDPRVLATVWWRQHGAEVDAEVVSALKRMRRPRKAVRP
jgi:hypothetical protein